MPNLLALDVETSTYSKGNPYDSRNKLVCYSYANEIATGLYNNAVLWDGNTVGLQYMVDNSDLIIGFNYKFDKHWLEKSGVSTSHKPVWDVQIAEFLLSNQTNKFPSLNETCEKYGIPVKLDVVKTEYWDKGIQTDAIPWDILREYAAHDAMVTLQCYHAQIKLMTPKQKQLCRLMCMDLYVLKEMEATGLPYDEQLCAKRAQEVEERIKEIILELEKHVKPIYSAVA